jgi:hypothetical protein
LELLDGILSEAMQSIIKYIGIGMIFYSLLIWFASIVWAIRDISNRTRDPVAIFIAMSITLFLPFIGLPIYFILRPSSTLVDTFENRLQEQLLVAEMHNLDICSNLRCKRPLKENWITCVYCGEQQRSLCVRIDCNTVISNKWMHCPKCGTSTPTMKSHIQAKESQAVNRKASMRTSSNLANSNKQLKSKKTFTSIKKSTALFSAKIENIIRKQTKSKK